MVSYFSTLPAEQRDHLFCLSTDGLVAVKKEITYAKHTLESAAKILTTAVALRRHSWLQLTNLPYDTMGLIKNLPLNGSGLFNSTANATLQDMDKSFKTSRTLGMSSSQRPLRSKTTYCRSWSRHSFSSGSQSPDRPWRHCFCFCFLI